MFGLGIVIEMHRHATELARFLQRLGETGAEGRPVNPLDPNTSARLSIKSPAFN